MDPASDGCFDATVTLPLSAAAAQRAGLGALRHVAVTGSTNDDLAGEARSGNTDAAVLVADHQRSGRGRMGRHWLDAGAPHHTEGRSRLAVAAAPVASDGARRPAEGRSLLVSLRLPGPVAAAHRRVAAVSAAAFQAASAALAGTGAVVGLKWPNDLLVSSGRLDGKLAGVLAEMVAGDRPVAVVGLGLNVGPVPGVPGAISLAEAGSLTGRDELLASLLDALPAYLDDPARTRSVLRSASATIGRQVRVEQAGGVSITGLARDIDDDGRLLLVDDRGERVIDGGDIVHLRHT